MYNSKVCFASSVFHHMFFFSYSSPGIKTISNISMLWQLVSVKRLVVLSLRLLPWGWNGRQNVSLCQRRPLRLSINHACGKTGPSQKGIFAPAASHNVTILQRLIVCDTEWTLDGNSESVWANLICLIGEKKTHCWTPLTNDIHIITHVVSWEQSYEKSIREWDNWLIFSKVNALHKH